MVISTRHIGETIIELTVTDLSGNNTITEDVCNLNGKIDEDFIMALREIADELEDKNNKIAERK